MPVHVYLEKKDDNSVSELLLIKAGLVTGEHLGGT